MKLIPAPTPGHTLHGFARHRDSRLNRARGFTLIEVLIASMVMTIIMLGVLTTMIQSRRLTEGSIVQNSANTILQGYIEQIKALAYNSLPVSPTSAPNPFVPATSIYAATEIGSGVADRLYLSAGTPPTTIPAIGAAAPTGAVDNPKSIPLKIPTVNPNDSLSLNVWLWVTDMTDATNHVTETKGVTMIYTYTFLDGARTKTIRGSVRTIRSVIPTR